MTIILDAETVRLAVERYLAQCVLREDAARRVEGVTQEWDAATERTAYRVQLAPPVVNALGTSIGDEFPRYRPGDVITIAVEQQGHAIGDCYAPALGGRAEVRP